MALRRGERSAFDAVFLEYQGRILGYLLRMCQDRGVAEELAQDTFLRLAEHATRLRPDTELGAWLFTVARNLYRSWRRWAWLDFRRREAVSAHSSSQASESLESAAMASQVATRLESVLATLPDVQREAFLLVCVDDLTPQEAAAVIGVRPDALRQRLARARATIAHALDLRENP